jgi:hypothetical protein
MHAVLDRQGHALVNELKGFLFEFLVGRNLARRYGLEAEFYKDIEPGHIDLLLSYEKDLRFKDLDTLLALNGQAEKMTAAIERKISKPLEKILLSGKATQDNHLRGKFVADLLVFDKENQVFPISLKLGKLHSFINTKSAGLKSFLSRYFNAEAELQTNFNQKVDIYFSDFSKKLFDDEGLEYLGDYRPWVAAGLPELPGQLRDRQKELLAEYYQRLKHLLVDSVEFLLKEDRQKSIDGLKHLAGLGHEQTMQAICYYGTVKGQKNLVSKALVHYPSECFFEDKTIKIVHSVNKTSFELVHGRVRLQLRIKPMNKFTACAYKLNCSVKFDS